MMNDAQLISYFENLAKQNLNLNHKKEGRDSFFYIENGYDLAEFDQSLRNTVQSPVMLLVADDGEFNDNNSAVYTQSLDGQFFILGRKTNETSVRQIRAICLPIVMGILGRMKFDSSKNLIIPGGLVHFRIDRAHYSKVGPINLAWYGYQVTFEFTCPFGFKVDSGTWHDR